MKSLEQKLKEFDTQGVTFHDAKKQLLKEGYGEDEISIAVASQPFDGKENKPVEPSTEAKVLAEDPGLASEIAETLLDHTAEHERDKLKAAAIASSFTHPLGRINPVSARGMSSLADQLDIPLFSALGLGLFITAILYGMSHTFHLFPLEYVVLFIRVYLTAVAGLFVIAMGRVVWRDWQRRSKQLSSPLRKVFHIFSLLVLLALCTWSVVSFLL